MTESRASGLKSHLCHLVVEGLWATFLASLSVTQLSYSVLICEIEISIYLKELS